jgi:hypothetical protein
MRDTLVSLKDTDIHISNVAWVPCQRVAAYVAFASLSLWGKVGGLHACGATYSYIVPLSNSSAKSFLLRSKSEKEGLPRGSTPDLGTSAQRLVLDDHNRKLEA